jgi:hypothetical protein
VRKERLHRLAFQSEVAKHVLWASRSSKPWRSRKRPTRSVMLFAKAVSSAPVGAFTQRNVSEPSERFDVHPIEEQHVEMQVEIERTPKALDQRHRAGVSALRPEAGLADQMHGDDAVDDPQHRTMMSGRPTDNG